MIQALRDKRVAEKKVRNLSEQDSLTGLRNPAQLKGAPRRDDERLYTDRSPRKQAVRSFVASPRARP